MLGFGVLGFAAALTAGSFVVSGSGAAAQADDPQPDLVENFEYPGAAAIEAARGIKLKKGDGHILFTECAAGANQIQVESTAYTAPNNLFCFKVIGTKGNLTLELDEAFLVHGNDYNATATWTDENGQVHNTPLRKNNPTGIGEGVTGQPGMLIELNATR